MKRFITMAAVVAFTLASAPLSAQTSTSGAAAQAGSQSGAISGASSNTNITFGSPPSDIKQRIESAPAVSAPAVFGGGHPCLAGKSGGVSVIGGGISYGQGDPEPACMAWIMGQPEVAIRIMMISSPKFCKAMGHVGYYRVGNKVVPIDCGNVKRGGIDTAGASYTTTRVSTSGTGDIRPKARPKLYNKCYMRDDGRIGITYTNVGRDNKAAASSACMTALGY